MSKELREASKKSEVLRVLRQGASLGKRIVFTNGCFDILHRGHVRYLADAKALGDILVVGVNSDASVKRLKGESRPIVSEDERVEMLEALKVVDHALLFDEDTPLSLIEEVRPDFLVKGGDWPVEAIVGHEFVASYGGKTLSLPFVEGSSTTSIVERVLASHAEDAAGD